MTGHIVKIINYAGFWIITGIAPEHRLYVMSLDGEGATMTINRSDVAARAEDYSVKINVSIFDDTKKGA